MENTLYYTFSTIAQSLAGAIAFLGAFVLFRLQSIAQLLRNSADLLCRSWLGDDELHRAAATADYSSFLMRTDVLIKQPFPSGWGTIHQAALGGMRLWLMQRDEILSSLKAALAVAAIVITLAVVVLAAVQKLAAQPALATCVLVLGVSAFAVSVVLIGNLVWKAARDA